MAPTLRSSVHGRKASQEPRLPDPGNEEDEEDEKMQSDDEMISSEVDDDMIEDDRSDVPASAPLQSSAEEFLRPLQETAERVSKQVEKFAQVLDKFNESRTLAGQELWQETWLLLDKYSSITRESAEKLKSSTSTHRQSQKNRKSLGDSSNQKQNLILEADLWTLKAELLPCQSPEMQEDCKFRQNSALAELHQYSKNEEIWSAFLEADPVACQYEVILDWLQQWKSKTSATLSDTDLSFYDQTQRGESSWDGGNIFTQVPIKRQKISRAHPGPLEPDLGIRHVHFRKSDEEPLVTQMDPDAALRQGSVLEVEDELYETSAWHASWEMLRRGTSSEEIREWWQERNQLWRASALANSGLETSTELNKAWPRIVNLASNATYTELCSELARNTDLQTDYENAVYSVLCGQYDQAAPVCKTVDDHFFTLLNALLIERYAHFVAAYKHKLQEPKEHAYTPSPSGIGRIAQYIKDLQANKVTKSEAHQPLKYLQSMIISDDLGSFFLQLGHAAAQMAHLTGESKSLFDPDEAQVSECAQVAAQDEDIIRYAAHLQLALQPLGVLDTAVSSPDSLAVMENNIVNYIGLLERYAKYSLLPLYTSKLSATRQPRVLGRILSKVTAPGERDTQMRLMKSYGIPVNRVIYTICDYARRTWTLKLEARGKDHKSARVIEYHERIVRIRAGFMGDELDQDEADVLQAHEWVNYIDKKNWGMAVWLMAALYKTLLLSGNLAAAKDLSEKVTLADTSMRVVGMNLGVVDPSQDPMEDGEEEEFETDEDKVSASPSKRRKNSRANHSLADKATSRGALADQSMVWAHLERLVQAMGALEAWQELADQVEKVSRNDVRLMKQAKKTLTVALGKLQVAMMPLLEQDFLIASHDDQEDADLAEIRNHYLPECVLGYNSALYFAGHAISRQYLVQCMDLAQQTAQNDTLTKAFTQSKRMQELVTAFAYDSQALLRANEHGSNSGRVRGKRNISGELQGRPDIWQVTMRAE